MSLIPIGTTILQAAANALLPLVFLRPRSIGGIIANVTVEERSVDELIITQHPVEQGASITDHAFKRPPSLTIIAAWSNSSIEAFGNPNYVTEIYDRLLALQESRVPFEVLTGKRLYDDMLMRRIFQTTDEKTENSLALVMEFEQIILVSTQTVSVPPAANMKMPQANGATERRGTISIAPGGTYNATAGAN